MDDTMTLVRKLGEKLCQYTQDEAPEGKILRVLKRLEEVDMTLDILQDTKIGKKVYKLRKMEGGGVGERARSLVKQWKQLVAEEEEDETEKVGRPSPSSEGGKGSKCSQDRETAGPRQASSDGKEASVSAVPLFLKDVDKQATKRASRLRVQQRLAQSTSSGQKRTQAPKQTQSLSAPVNPASSSRQSPSPLPWKPSPGIDVSSITVDNDTLLSYNAFYNSEGESSRKRAPPTDVNAASMLSKKTRTQVYSGKTSSGPAIVRKLLDLCVEVLKKNIDALEFLGPLPSFILDQILERCDVQQLKRLEKHNPQLMEEFDSGWKKLCRKHFRSAVPAGGQTWREVYSANEANKETQLKQITQDIKARKMAAEEPMRQTAKIAAPMADPTKRRRGGWGAGGGSFGGRSKGSFSNRGMSVKPVQSSLMKRTMKMAKERSHMLSMRRK